MMNNDEGKRIATLVGILAAGDFSSLNRAHLGNPGRSRLNFADGTNLVTGVTRNSNIVASLQG